MCIESERKVKECPNCDGIGQAGLIPLANGKRKVATYYMCLGSCTVPEWDYERLSKMVQTKNLQMDLFNGKAQESFS
jgi:hypothetical protein